MKKHVLFIPHSPLQFEIAHHWGEVAKAAGFDTICLLLFQKLDVYLQKNHHKSFGEVIVPSDLFGSENKISFAEKVREISAFEKEHEECQFSRDWSVDRAFQHSKPDYEYTVDLTFQWIRALEKLFVKFNIRYAVSEKLFLPQRIIHYMISANQGKHFFPLGNRFFDRFYFEEELDWNWKDVVGIYNLNPELYKEAPDEVLKKYQKIVEKGDKGILDTHQEKGHVGKVPFGSFNSALKKVINRPRFYENVYEEFLNNNSDESFTKSVFKKLLQIRNLSAYKKIISSNYPTGKYVLYLFHLQPEYTIDALAYNYSNQAEFVVRVAKMLPAEITLVIKENPMGVGKINRPPEYYEHILRQPNIKLIDHRLDSHKLVKNAQAIITLTGTVGLEAMFFGKPVIVFGNIFYSSFKWAYKANSFEEGIRKLKKVLKNDDYRIDFLMEEVKIEALNIMTSMYKASYEGKMINAFHPEMHRAEKNIDKLKKAFNSVLKKQD